MSRFHHARLLALTASSCLLLLANVGVSPALAAGSPGTAVWHQSLVNGTTSSPAVSSDGQTVYIGSYDDNLYAVDATTGAVDWTFLTGDVINSSPTVGADGTIYVGSNDGSLYAVSPDGTEKWAFAAGGEIDSTAALGRDGSTVYIASFDGDLYAIDAATGHQDWAFTTGSAIASSPAIGADGTIYVGSDDSHFYAVNPNGTEKWAFAASSGFDSSPAIGADGRIYVGCQNNNLYAINPNGTEKWAFATGAAVHSSPAIGPDGSTVYVGSCDYKLYAVDAASGQAVWTSPFTANDQFISSPAVGDDGTIYVGSVDHNLYAIDPNGTEKWAFGTGGAIWSSPAIATDGVIYVGSWDCDLYAIYGSSLGLAGSAWPMFQAGVQHVADATSTIDVTPPVTDVAGRPGGWTNQPVTLTFTATDNIGGSGVAYIEHSTDSGMNWTTGASLVVAAPAGHAGDGVHTILYRSVDNAGNRETAKSLRVKIDTRRPTTRARYPAYVAHGHTAHPKYTIADPRPGSPTADVTVKVKNSAGTVVKTLTLRAMSVNKPLTASFVVPSTWRPGIYRFFVFATDQAGNMQTVPVGQNKLIVRLTNQQLSSILAARLKRHTGRLAVGVINLTTGARVVYNGGSSFHTASVVKADILATLLLQHQASGSALSGEEQALARRMIEFSDNNAATALWNDVGGVSGVARANVRLGLIQTTPNVYWGLTDTTAADQLILLSDLVSAHSPLSSASRSYELGLMRHVASYQAWGVTAAATPGTSSAVKNGWLPDPYLWVINSIGVIHNSGQVLLVVVLSNEQPTEAGGIAQVEAAAVAAVHVATAVTP